MNEISSLLEKFKKLLSTQGGLKISVIEAVKQVCGVEIESKQIRTHNKTIFIDASPALKNNLFLKKSQIINYIREKTGAEIADIR